MAGPRRAKIQPSGDERVKLVKKEEIPAQSNAAIWALAVISGLLGLGLTSVVVWQAPESKAVDSPLGPPPPPSPPAPRPPIGADQLYADDITFTLDVFAERMRRLHERKLSLSVAGQDALKIALERHLPGAVEVGDITIVPDGNKVIVTVRSIDVELTQEIVDRVRQENFVPDVRGEITEGADGSVLAPRTEELIPTVRQSIRPRPSPPPPPPGEPSPPPSPFLPPPPPPVP